MESLTEDQFRQLKKSDTFVIYGCGYSIATLSLRQKLKLAEFDSIGFNWFCKSHIPTTFYILREQCPPKQKGLAGENAQDLIGDLQKHYAQTCLIIIDLQESSNAWSKRKIWIDHGNLFTQKGVVLKEKYYQLYRQQKYELFFKQAKKLNVFQQHIMYSTCTISLALHLASWFRYERIVFVGVDLYDHRYFWLPPDVLREHTKRSKGKRKLDSQHFTADVTVKMIKDFALTCPDVKLFVHNPNSLLAKAIPLWSG
jgi:hypothetical protein